MTSPGDRYRTDVLASGWQRRNKITSTDLVIAPGLVVEDPTSGFCGAVIRWENGLVVLEDRHRRRRSFPLGPGFHHEGKPVRLIAPVPRVTRPTRTASGSVVAPAER